MKIEYKVWKPNKGYEQDQAAIFNRNNPEIPNSVTGPDIIKRYEREKIDPNTVRYAFANGEMIAYVQARDYPELEETHCGHPWTLEKCPSDVQHKLFNDLLNYLKTRNSKYPIRMPVSIEDKTKIDFFKSKDLELKSKKFRHYLDIKHVANASITNDYRTKRGEVQDIPSLVDLIKKDGRFTSQFKTDADIKDYFRSRVFEDPEKSHSVLVYSKNNELVTAAAPLIYTFPHEEIDPLILRFHSYLPDHGSAFENLVIGIAKECLEADYGADRKLAFFINKDEKHFLNILEKYDPEQKVVGLVFGPKN